MNNFKFLKARTLEAFALISAVHLCAPLAFAQSSIWLETFDELPVGARDDDGATAWSSTRPGGNFGVDDNRFEVASGGGEAEWISAPIAIEGGPVTVGIDLLALGGLEEQSNFLDTLRVSYQIDGGAEQLFADRNGAFGGERAARFESAAIVGGELTIIVRALTTGGNEVYAFDNVQVTRIAPERALVDARFDTGFDGFGYEDDAFEGTSEPGYASGERVADDGFVGGGLAVTVGNVDNADIFGASGAFATVFSLDEAAEVVLELSVRLELSERFDDDEFVEARITLDGADLGSGRDPYLLRRIGGGETGWQRMRIELGELSAGAHELAIGAYNNKKTFNNEVATVTIDDVRVVVPGAGPAPASRVISGSDTSTIRRPVGYGKPNQSRLWFNSRAGRWDAVVPRDDENGGVSASDHFVMTDVAGQQVFTNVELEDRDFARIDTFWDDAAGLLYVLASHPAQPQFWRLRYDEPSDSYAIEVGEPGTGVAIPGMSHPATELGGSSPATLHVSSNGRVWVAVLPGVAEPPAQSGLLVQVSEDGGATWLAAPVSIDETVRLGVTTFAAFEDAGQRFVGLFAGENGETAIETHFLFFYIDEGDDPTVIGNWIDDTDFIPPPVGSEFSDDHVSAARDAAGNLYFAVKTEGGGPTDAVIKLFRRTPDGVWSQHVVTEAQAIPEQSRPSVLVDDARGEITVYVSGAEVVGPNQREAGRIRAPLANLDALVSAPFVPLFSVEDTVFTDISSPRQSVDETSGIVVLAHNRTDANVWVASEAIDANEPQVLIDADFDVDEGGFAYEDDAFRGTSEPFYARGFTLDDGGFTGGTIEVNLGGRDNQNINGISGGWRASFELDRARPVTLSLRYRLTQAANFESNEFSQVMVAVDGALVEGEGIDYLAEVRGDGNGGSPITTGWQVLDVDLGVLDAGGHDLLLGGYSNRKTWFDEVTFVRFDDVRVVAN